MSVIVRALINSKYASSSLTTEYTAPADTKAIIDKFTATNIDTESRTIDVHLVPSGDTAGDANKIVMESSIGSGEEKDISKLKSHVLEPGDFIAVNGEVASKIILRASGREVT